MKRFAIAIAMCAMLLSSTDVRATDYTWTGASSNLWIPASGDTNWSVGLQQWPGRINDSPDVIIDDATNQATVILSGTMTNSTRSVISVLVDANAAGAAMQLTINSGARMRVDNDVKLVAGSANGDTAEFEYNAGQFGLTGSFDMDGGTNGDRVAILDINGDLDLPDTDVDCASFCDIVVANSKTFTVEDMVIASGADFEVSGETSVAATFKYDSVSVTGIYRIIGPVTVEAY